MALRAVRAVSWVFLLLFVFMCAPRCPFESQLQHSALRRYISALSCTVLLSNSQVPLIRPDLSGGSLLWAYIFVIPMVRTVSSLRDFRNCFQGQKWRWGRPSPTWTQTEMLQGNWFDVVSYLIVLIYFWFQEIQCAFAFVLVKPSLPGDNFGAVFPSLYIHFVVSAWAVACRSRYSETRPEHSCDQDIDSGGIPGACGCNCRGLGLCFGGAKDLVANYFCWSVGLRIVGQ